MAVIGTAVNIGDIQARLDPDGNIAQMIEIIKDKNAIVQDAMWVEGNLTNGHKTTLRTGYPEPTWRIFNKGVQPTKTDAAPVTDTCGMLRAWGEVDKELADMNNNAMAFRLSEDTGKIEGMSNGLATAMFYGNQATDPEQITGLAPRYNSFSTDEDEIGYNVVNAGGSGSDNTSIFAVTWGDQSVHGIYPKGSTAGLAMEDRGVETKEGSDGLQLVYRSYYKWDCGLTVRNWKDGGRVCNIDVSDLTTDASAGANLVELMVTLYYRMENPDMGNTVMYANRTVQEYLHHQAMNQNNVRLRIEEQDGKPVTKFLGIPIRRSDAIVNTESAVS